MSLDKLKKLEQSLVMFKERYIDLETEKDGLRDELEAARGINEHLIREKEDMKLRVGSLLDLLKGLGL